MKQEKIDFTGMSREDLLRCGGHLMFQLDDPIVQRHTKNVREYERNNPHRTWKTGLSKKQIKELKKLF